MNERYEGRKTCGRGAEVIAMSSDVWTVKEWCALASCSKPFLYKLWKEGSGPRSVNVGRKRIVLEGPAEFFARIAAEQMQPGGAA